MRAAGRKRRLSTSSSDSSSARTPSGADPGERVVNGLGRPMTVLVDVVADRREADDVERVLQYLYVSAIDLMRPAPPGFAQLVRMWRVADRVGLPQAKQAELNRAIYAAAACDARAWTREEVGEWYARPLTAVALDETSANPLRRVALRARYELYRAMEGEHSGDPAWRDGLLLGLFGDVGAVLRSTATDGDGSLFRLLCSLPNPAMLALVSMDDLLVESENCVATLIDAWFAACEGTKSTLMMLAKRSQAGSDDEEPAGSWRVHRYAPIRIRDVTDTGISGDYDDGGDEAEDDDPRWQHDGSPDAWEFAQRLRIAHLSDSFLSNCTQLTCWVCRKMPPLAYSAAVHLLARKRGVCAPKPDGQLSEWFDAPPRRLDQRRMRGASTSCVVEAGQTQFDDDRMVYVNGAWFGVDLWPEDADGGGFTLGASVKFDTPVDDRIGMVCYSLSLIDPAGGPSVVLGCATDPVLAVDGVAFSTNDALRRSAPTAAELLDPLRDAEGKLHVLLDGLSFE